MASSRSNVHPSRPLSMPDDFACSPTPLRGRQTDSDVVHSFKGSANQTSTNCSASAAPYGLLVLQHEPSRAITASNRNTIASGAGNIRAWRSQIPFSVPLYYPELQCPETELVHSATLKFTSDRGVRFLHLPSHDEGTVEFQAECGVVGLSLRKHCRAFAQSSYLTYPGIVQTSQVRRELEVSRHLKCSAA